MELTDTLWYDFDHEIKIKVGTIQQNNNVIYRVNLEAEAKRFTHRHTQTMHSIDILSIPQEGGGGHLPNKGR